jgi:Flp pilus assembly protein TadD
MDSQTTGLRLVESAAGRELVRLESPDLDVFKLTRFTPDGARLITSNEPRGIHIWDLRLLRRELAERGLDWDAPPFAADKVRPGPIELHVDWGDYARLSKLQIAKNYDRSVAAAPQLAVRWHFRGKFHWEAGHYEEALRDLQKAVDLEPRTALACNYLARLYGTAPPSTRNAGRAVELAERAVQLQPGEWDYQTTLGIALYRCGRYSEALAQMDKCLKGHAGQADTLDLYILALCHHHLGHREQASAYFRKAAVQRQGAKESRLSAAELDLFEAELRTVLKSIE